MFKINVQIIDTLTKISRGNFKEEQCTMYNTHCTVQKEYYCQKRGICKITDKPTFCRSEPFYSLLNKYFLLFLTCFIKKCLI